MSSEQDPAGAVQLDSGCEQVRLQVDDGVASLTLDRPRAINALDPAMMEAISRALHAWVADEQVRAIHLYGSGERGFCAGADVRAIRQLCLDDKPAAVRFFEVEYAVNDLIAGGAKPFTSHLYGVSMGGGLGLGVHAQKVLASADLKLAMPEVGIGLFPDVGITWNLAQAPGELGTYLAMTGTTIDAASARDAHLVDQVVTPPGSEVAPEGGSSLAQARDWIDECFSGSSAETIVERLAAHPEADARAAADEIMTKSPWSVKVALEAVRRAATMDVSQVLRQDLALARNYVADSDFVEGVRAQLVDKDRTPHWRHAGLAEVPDELVRRMFQD